MQVEIRTRAMLKSKVTIFSKFLLQIQGQTSVSSTDLIQISDRLNKFERVLDEYEEIQNLIDTNTENLELEITERENFDNMYYKQLAIAKNILNANKFRADAGSRCSDVLSESGASEITNQNSNQTIKLPTIEIPKFSGKYLEWLEFRDTYTSLIHDNSNINEIQKFHYLRSTLQGNARDVIKSIQLSQKNYQSAWQALIDRYDNHRLLIHNHIKALFTIEPLMKESGEGLLKIIETVNENLRALEQLGQPIDKWDALIIYMVASKFDRSTEQKWEGYKINNETATLDNLRLFIKSRAELLEMTRVNHPEKLKYKASTTRGLLAVENKDAVPKCKICDSAHYIQNCEEFLKLSPNERSKTAMSKRLCLNCLKGGHYSNACRRSACKKCSARHHTLLHFESQASNAQTSDSTVTTAVNNVNLSANASCAQVLLSTVLLQVLDKTKVVHTIRALLDSGSQASYITEDLCKRLEVETEITDLTILGLNNSSSNVNLKCELQVESIHNKFVTNVSCFVIPRITERLPSTQFRSSDFDIPQNIKLADPTFYKSNDIDMLIGSDLFWSIICIGQIRLGVNKPILQKTKFGWIVSGPVGKSREKTTVCNFSQSCTVQEQLCKFWEMEECPRKSPLSQDEIACEKHFCENTRRAADGRFIVALPLKENINKLGESYKRAEQRFLSLERKLQKNCDLKMLYVDFMDEYESLGHMRKVKNRSENEIAYYMPHHGVLRESSLTTKLRAVFDASAPTDTGASLNNLQFVGPTIQDDLIAILLRFRQHSFVVSGDIAKMYRQVQIKPEHQRLQRILWRKSSDEPIEVFELLTVTYGTTAASFLAIRCLFQLAEENKKAQPELAKIIESDFYVDDLLTGGNTIEEAALIAKGISDILRQGCFDLRKFYSNNCEVLKYVKDNSVSAKTVEFGKSESAKTLGLIWCPNTDSLKYNICEIPESTKFTKRTILSGISQVFDPLGLVSPCVINVKIMLQQLWLEKLTWDEAVPANIHTSWSEFRRELPCLNSLTIKRHVVCHDSVRIEMHGFSDASERAYGACVYLKSVDKNGQIYVDLICAKTKVAPLKTVTLPRLELSGALVLARLARKVTEALRLKIDQRTFWTDSTIVLGWLKTTPNKLKTFVSHRVAETQDLTCSDTWRHVPSTDNPADILSRGVKPREIKDLSIWWHGPHWLKKDESEWPCNIQYQGEVPETRKVVQTLFSTPILGFPFERFSKLERLKRVTAWLLRFNFNCKVPKEERKRGNLTLGELDNALKQLIKIAQGESFASEIKTLVKCKGVERKSRLLSLNPFLDSESIVRVGGRIQNSSFLNDKKHPVLLCSRHHLTELLFESEHLKLLHAGPQLTLASMREKFWPILGRNLAKRIVRRCLVCFRHNPKGVQPIMSSLPASRLRPGPVFNTTGVDYAGPFSIKDKKGRGAKLSKCYVGLFICFAVKAVHLELITDLTKESFILALKRFVSRRGKPLQIYSDNGTNFVSANSELRNFLKNFGDQLSDEFSRENIDWKFIPASSPHFGGLWEAGVKSCKHHLKRVLGDAHLTYEEFYSLLVQIEAVLNSRPLFPMSADPNDLVPLTPGHFLVGRPLASLPESDVKELKIGRLSRYQHIQQMQQHFWKRWQQEYVSELQQRLRWKTTKGELRLGTMVLIKEDNAPPLRWKMGRIVRLISGLDGVNRVAVIKTQGGEIRRSFAKICPLPTSES